MKIFHCDNCSQLVFFENVKCVKCGATLAFLPDVSDVGSFDGVGESKWRSRSSLKEGVAYRLCQNYKVNNVCNWAIPSDDPNPFCQSCRLNQVIPNLSRPGAKDAWYRLEIAKRRLIYSLLELRLPVASKIEEPVLGLAFEFLADTQGPDAKPVLTGHDEGLITINIAEADDVTREKRRKSMNEPYRTLLGHFRHEVGHYYWDRLIKEGVRLNAFRKQFGDERKDYAESLKKYYNDGPPANWQESCVSAYATSHAWEDWAETWAHYLHMIDALETAMTCGLSLKPSRPDEPSLKPVLAPNGSLTGDFDRMIENWFSLTYVLNNLNRGLGLPDGYPFILSPSAIDKLRFVHDTIAAKSLVRV